MSDYRCKVRIIHEKEITVHAKNKKEAEEEAKSQPRICLIWGTQISSSLVGFWIIKER